MCSAHRSFPQVRAMVIDQLSMQPSEIILIVWVGATWGYFPAFTVLICEDTSENAQHAFQFSECEQIPHHRISNAMLAVSLLYCIWLNFSLLTPLGLLEFNPSKVIVTGGFFGVCSSQLLHGWV